MVIFSLVSCNTNKFISFYIIKHGIESSSILGYNWGYDGDIMVINGDNFLPYRL